MQQAKLKASGLAGLIQVDRTTEAECPRMPRAISFHAPVNSATGGAASIDDPRLRKQVHLESIHDSSEGMADEVSFVSIRSRECSGLADPATHTARLAPTVGRRTHAHNSNEPCLHQFSTRRKDSWLARVAVVIVGERSLVHDDDLVFMARHEMVLVSPVKRQFFT